MKKILLEIKKELALIFSSKAQSLDGNRIAYLDMARGFAIFLVVMGHRGFISYQTNAWLSTFHLPSFFIISGFLLTVKKEYENSFSSIIKKKAKTLLIPYFAYSLLSLLCDFIYIARDVLSFSDLKTHFFETITFRGYSVLWFLPVMFFAETIALLLIKKFPKLNFLFVCLCAVGTFILFDQAKLHGWNIFVFELIRFLYKSAIAASFIIVGNIFSEVGPKAEKFSWKEFVPGIILFSVNIFAAPRITIFDLNSPDISSLPLYLLLGITGSYGLLLILRNIPNIPLISYFGKNSLIVMCTHINTPILYVASLFALHFAKSFTFASETFTLNVYSMFFTFLFEIPVILIINRIKKFIKK